MKKVLITGSNGFIGRECANFFSSQYSILSPSREELDIRGKENVAAYLKTHDPDIIIHCAGTATTKSGPDLLINNNIVGTFNLVDSLVRPVKFLFLSSVVVYGDGNLLRPHVEIDHCYPKSLYASSKLACEHIINTYHIQGRLRALIFRPCAVVGTNLTHGVTYDFIKKIKNEEKLEILGDYPGSIKPYIHVNALIKWMEWGIRKDLTGVYNVCSNNPISIDRVADVLMEMLGEKKSKVWLGARANWAGDNPILNCSNAKIKSELNLETNSEMAIKEIFLPRINDYGFEN